MRFTPRSTLLVATDTEWTACFWRDVRTAGLWLETLAPCDDVSFAWDCTPGAEVFGFNRGAAISTRDQAYRRTRPVQRDVRVWHEDGKWWFSEYGEPLPFEDVNRYRKHARKDRLDPDTMLRYANALGIPIDQLAAFTGDAVLLLPGELPNPEVERSEVDNARFGIQLSELIWTRAEAALGKQNGDGR
jgi:hypothetical protein